MMNKSRRLRRPRVTVTNLVLTVTVLLSIVCGGILLLADRSGSADLVWAASTALVLAPLLVGVGGELVHGRTGVDVIALAAMAGALLLGEFLAGAVVALMLSGGQALEDFAGQRARQELRSLVERAPRSAHRWVQDELTTIPVDAVRAGDLILVKSGEIVPVDGILSGGTAVLDESALTGEARPQDRNEGDVVRSGVVNVGGAFEFRAVTGPEGSTYAAIVRLVEEAQASKAPFVRMADRFAIFFLAVSFGIAGAAWLVSGDPIRGLAVLVVATPCPLILAAPVAIVSGISRAAKLGVIVKGGAALEALGRARVLLLDKTGTLTIGMSVVREVVSLNGYGREEVLRLAGSLDQVSAHILASAIVKAALDRGLDLSFPTNAAEQLGRGITGVVDGHTVTVGKADLVTMTPATIDEIRHIRRRAALEGSSTVFVRVDGLPAGAVLLDDPVRPDAVTTIRELRAAGIENVVMVTGDQAPVAEAVGAIVGVDSVLPERTPAEKVDSVVAARADGPTAMVGDGINDAPALAAADVGVALGARGASASSETADVVIVVDRLDRLAEAMRIARRARHIALQSVVAGMCLSIAGMGLAAVGILLPVAGAMVQEIIDVAVILNALRARRPERHARSGELPGASNTRGQLMQPQAAPNA